MSNDASGRMTHRKPVPVSSLFAHTALRRLDARPNPRASPPNASFRVRVFTHPSPRSRHPHRRRSTSTASRAVPKPPARAHENTPHVILASSLLRRIRITGVVDINPDGRAPPFATRRPRGSGAPVAHRDASHRRYGRGCETRTKKKVKRSRARVAKMCVPMRVVA